jgi:hypothetical protein
MAVDYKIVEIGGSFVIEEKNTGHLIRAFDNYNEAKKYMKFLNLGGAFSGWTPTFILNNSSKNM